jgi:hypothetical protein
VGFRDDLDISGIITKYETFTKSPVQPSRTPWEAPVRPGEGETPGREGFGPLRCSTSRAVAQQRLLFAWDPNRYYRDLGVPWPYVNASKGSLMRYYMHQDGQSSVRMTYCLKQLLNHREEYDALPLGIPFMNDTYVQAALKQRAIDEAQRRCAEGDYATADEILDEWGYILKDDPDDDHFHDEEAGLPRILDTPPGEESALIRELEMAVPTLVVGMVGKTPHEYLVGKTGQDWVVYLNSGATVSQDLARKAATALTKQITHATRD